MDILKRTFSYIAIFSLILLSACGDGFSDQISPMNESPGFEASANSTDNETENNNVDATLEAEEHIGTNVEDDGTAETTEGTDIVLGESTFGESVTDINRGRAAIARIPTATAATTPDLDQALTVKFLAPLWKQPFSENDTLIVEVQATSEEKNITSVDLYFDGVFVGSDANPPYTWNDTSRGSADAILNNLTVGTHQLRAIATDDSGATAQTRRTLIVNAKTDVAQCNDGIDNDGDGLTDWQYDVGCWGAEDQSENAGPLRVENGWTTFDLSPDSRVIYVSSSDGDDSNDGLTPNTAKATPEAGFALIRDGFPDFLLLKRGDTWRDTTLTRRDLGDGRFGRVEFKSGRSEKERIVISSYGNSTARPRLEIETHFVNDNGRDYHHFAISGLAFISYKKEPGSPVFDGHSGGAVRLVSNDRTSNVLLEDNYVEYGEFIIQAVDNVKLRRNVVYRSYHMGTCSFREDGSRNANGDPGYRPSGLFMGADTNDAVLDGNIWDENGWNPDLPLGDANNPGPCATIYNHNVYLSDVKNIKVRNNVFLRASSIGLKVSGNERGGMNGLIVNNNLFAEGEIGIAMGGNGRVADTHVNALVRKNVFTDIGRTMPTTRSFTWGITVENNNNALYINNLFVNPLLTSNSFAFGLADPENTDVTIKRNTVYGYQQALRVVAGDAWDSVSIAQNRFVTDVATAPHIYHKGNFDNVIYSNNEYASSYTSENENADGWFNNGYPFTDIDEWRIRSGETNARVSTYEPVDSQRNVDSYAEYLGIGTTLDDFAREARKQSRFNFREELTAKAVNDYIRAGFKNKNSGL